MGPATPAHYRLHAGLTIGGASGIALLFLPFTADVVPLRDLVWDWRIWRNVLVMAAPCIVLPLAVFAGYATWLVKGRLPRWTTVGALSLSLLLALAIVADSALADGNDLDDFAFVALMLIAFAAGGWISATGGLRDEAVRGLIAMQSVYAVPMSYFLAAFAVDYQIGAWLGLVTASVYLAQMALLLQRPGALLIFLIPLIGLMLLTSWFVGF